ncbi:MAG: ABC transporter ATP-binding protein [Burkholderiaceae bacterium]
MAVTLTNVTKSFGEVVAVEPTSIEIRTGELLALLGPSGCGKTTTLRMVAGFVDPTGGTIRIGKRDVTHVPVHKRNVGMVFQGYALFPHLTVSQNIEFGLRLRGWDKERKARRVAEMLRWVRLEAMAGRSPKALSGGQQQRVALARAMAIEPDVLLLDEPFSALDAKLRTQLRGEIRELQQQAHITSVFVTHDQEEAMAIADRIGVMSQGRLEQLGSAEDLYRRPASRFVASFIGRCNLIEGRSIAPGCFEAKDGKQLHFAGGAEAQATALCFRPENARLVETPPHDANTLEVTLKAATYLGPVIEHEVVTPAGERLMVATPSASVSRRAEPGQRLHLSWRVEDCFALA